nr:alpha-protein kinase 2 isoform X1 [Manis javanica]XP_036871997.1 alpha-protein kinase 2 isoform X1 [Manis javanica]
MTDSEGPQRHTLCFLSTLLSQKVPEKSNTSLRCIISGEPKPEVTWYKNGQTIHECGIVSSHEFFQNQYIHVLHLYCCTKHDTAVYQISAKNCFGMICCSASIEVECSAENLQLSLNAKDDADTVCKHGTETHEPESTNQINGEEHPGKEEESTSLGTPTAAGSPSSKFNCLCSLQLLARNDISTSSFESPLDVKGTRHPKEAYDLDNTEVVPDGELFPNSSSIPDKQNVFCHRTMHSKVSRLIDDALNNGNSNEEILNSSHQNPKLQKYISFSRPLSEAATPTCPDGRATIDKQVSPQVSTKDSDSDYELCPEMTLTCTEEFSDDDLEYLECSDVMTDYSNAVWQRNLQGTEHVFLLESDDEEMEFSERCLGGCEHFLGEMGCGPRVSDDAGPMDATTGFWGYHSQPQDAGVRSNPASAPSPSSWQTGTTLTLGPHQDGTSTVTDQGRYKLPTPPGPPENDSPGIPGETRDRHQAGEEFTRDSLLNMDKAVTETEMKRPSGESEGSSMSQCLEIPAEKRAGDKNWLSKRGSEKPARVRRLVMRGKVKELSPYPKGSGTESTLHLLCPKEPAKHPLTQSEKREGSHAKAEAPDLNPQFPAGECAIATHAEQEAKPSPTPPGLLLQEGSSNFKGEGVRFNHLFETSPVPDQSDHPQVQIQETVRERISPSRMPSLLESAGEKSAFTETTTNFLPSLGGINEESTSLAPHLEAESCTQGSQHAEGHEREDSTSVLSWEDLGHELSIPEANNENMSPCELSVHVPQDMSLSVASPEPTNTVSITKTTCSGTRGREVACVTECLGAGGQGACDTMESPDGSPADKYLPQEICSLDLELAEGQSKVADLCSPDKTLDVLFQTQGSELPLSTCESSKVRNSSVSPLFISTFTWNTSHNSSEGATEENLAEVASSTSTVASAIQAGQEGPSTSNSGGLEARQPPSSDSNAFVQFTEGGGEIPRTHGPDTGDTPASHGSVVKSSHKKSTLATHLECLRVTRESGDTSTVTFASNVHPAKYHPVSIAGHSHTEGLGESSLQAPEENIFQLHSNVQLDHILNASTIETPEEPLCMNPSEPGVRAHEAQLPQGEGFCGKPALQTDKQPGGKSWTAVRADNRSETTQRGQPHQRSLSEDDCQESLPTTSAVQGQIQLVPLDHSSAHSREERGQSGGTSVSMGAAATVDGGGQVLTRALPPSNTLLGETKGGGPGLCEAGRKLKIITLEAPIVEDWSPRQLTDSGCQGSEAGPETNDRVWAIADFLRSDALVPDRAPCEAAVGPCPQAEVGSALASNREIHDSEEQTCVRWARGQRRHAPGGRLSSWYLGQPRFLESSVDPVGEKEFCVTDVQSEASKTGGKANINNVSRNQEENHIKVDRPAFFKEALIGPKILESSVDPVDEAGVLAFDPCHWGCTLGDGRKPGEKLSRGAPEPSESTLEVSNLNHGNLSQRVEVQPALLHIPWPQQSGETIPSENSIPRNQEDRETVEAAQSQHDKANVGAQPAVRQVPCPDEDRETIPSGCTAGQTQEDSEQHLREAEPSNKAAECAFPTLPLSSCLAIMTRASVGDDTHNSTGQIHHVPEDDLVEPRNHPHVFSDSEETGVIESESGKCLSSPGDHTWLPCTSWPEGDVPSSPVSHKIEEPQTEESQIGETPPASVSCSPAVSSAFSLEECTSEKATKTLHGPCGRGCTLGDGRKPRGKLSPGAAQTRRFPGALPAETGAEGIKKKQETSGGGHIAEGVKRKILSRVAALRLRLEEKDNVRKSSSFLKKMPKLEAAVLRTDEMNDPKKPPYKREGKAPVLLEKIQAEIVPDHSGNVKLSCQFAEIHEDSTIWWTKDSKSIAHMQRSAGDNSTVSLAIIQASQKDQGLYYCCIKNSYGKSTAEFNLTAEVLKQLSSHQDPKGCEEIEFSQLIFREDFLSDSYFGDRLRGQIATEELHFGEGVHRKAFRSKVMQGLTPVFKPGHACVLKVHNSVAYGTRNNDELVQRNYKLAAQECYVQNTARYYAKIYAAEARPLEGFGEVPEIIPIFLIHRPENNIPYATVEEELIGEFVKYSIRDGKEINFLRRESEAGQKCCTFQHWVYQKTSGCLLVTDMQGVGMKLTDVGIATLAKGYKGFKGNCSMTFIDQFKALHQCNKYCKMLGLKSLQNNTQKQKKPSTGKSKIQPNSTTVKKMASGTPAEKKS